MAKRVLVLVVFLLLSLACICNAESLQKAVEGGATAAKEVADEVEKAATTAAQQQGTREANAGGSEGTIPPAAYGSSCPLDDSYAQIPSDVNRLRLRTGPGTNYTVIGMVVAGQCYDVQETKPGWLKVNTSLGTGWISQEFVKFASGQSPRWKILILIYAQTDFVFTDSQGVKKHVVAELTPEEQERAEQAALRFFNEDVPILNSGSMYPIPTVRYPQRPITQLTFESTCQYSPIRENVASDLDPAFDSVVVIWADTGILVGTNEEYALHGCYGATWGNGTSQTYATIPISGISPANRNVFKHEWGHSILSYFEEKGVTAKPVVTNHINDDDTIYVNCATGQRYILEDEGDIAPIPNSIYNNYSGFTHDYYSGLTATIDQPTRCLGITPEAWASGGPVSVR